MACADVGDDAYGEDPTVRRLQEEYAARVGKPAALFVPSGTMANQIALRLLAQPGSTVIAGARQHVVAYESGAAGMNVAAQFHLLDDSDGCLSPEGVRWALEAEAHHYPSPSLVCIENTHMAASGRAWNLEEIEAVSTASGDTPVHMDGARLFNASVSTSTAASALAAPVTTVMTCLSKGLCAPVGSLLAGPADLIGAARLERRRLGGGMRQAGVIAAAGLVALGTMIDRLAEDHERASLLARAVSARWDDCGCDPSKVRTNIVTFRHPRPAQLLDHLCSHGVLAGTIAPQTVRLVTHHDVDDAGVSRAVRAIADAPA